MKFGISRLHYNPFDSLQREFTMLIRLACSTRSFQTVSTLAKSPRRRMEERSKWSQKRESLWWFAQLPVVRRFHWQWLGLQKILSASKLSLIGNHPWPTQTPPKDGSQEVSPSGGWMKCSFLTINWNGGVSLAFSSLIIFSAHDIWNEKNMTEGEKKARMANEKHELEEDDLVESWKELGLY